MITSLVIFLIGALVKFYPGVKPTKIKFVVCNLHVLVFTFVHVFSLLLTLWFCLW